MKVLAVIHYYPPHHGGGQGLHLQWFAHGLARHGHTVQVLTTRPDPDAGLALPAEPVAVARTLVGIPPGLPARELLTRTLHNRRTVRATLRAFAPDVVLCGGMDGVGFNTYHAATRSGVPSLSWLGDTWLGQAWANLPAYDPYVDLARGGRGAGPGLWLKRALGGYGRLQGLYAGAKPAGLTPVAAISQFVLQHLRDSGAPVSPDAEVLPVVLDGSYFQPDGQPVGHGGQRSTPLRALFVGRLEPLKGPDLAVAAVAEANALGADVTLTFAGLHQERHRPELERYARERGVAGRVEWAGTPPLGGLIPLYRRHDVFLFPSRIVEGLGVVNLEAMACGLPVVGTADSGAAELIRDGETGYRVARDDAAAIGRHLARLHADRPLLESLSAGAARLASGYHPDAVVKRLEALLAKSIARGAS